MNLSIDELRKISNESVERKKIQERERREQERLSTAMRREHARAVKAALEKISDGLIRVALRGFDKYEPDVYSDLYEEIKATLTAAGYDVRVTIPTKNSPFVKATIAAQNLADFCSKWFTSASDPDDEVCMLFAGISCGEFVGVLEDFSEIREAPSSKSFKQIKEFSILIEGNFSKFCDVYGYPVWADDGFDGDKDHPGFVSLLSNMIEKLEPAEQLVSELSGNSDKLRRTFTPQSQIYISAHSPVKSDSKTEFFPTAEFFEWISGSGKTLFDELEWIMRNRATNGEYDISLSILKDGSINSLRPIYFEDRQIGSIPSGGSSLYRILCYMGFKAELNSSGMTDTLRVQW